MKDSIKITLLIILVVYLKQNDFPLMQQVTVFLNFISFN